MQNAPKQAQLAQDKARRFSFRRVLVITAILASVLVFAIPFCVGAIGAYALVRAPCSDYGNTPANYGLQYQDLTFPSRSGGVYRAFFIPGYGERAQGTVIVPPAYSGGRGGMLYEAEILARAGLNIFMYESRVCGGKGTLSLGYRDVEDIGDALAYLRQNAAALKVDPNRVALHGFSSAGAASLMAIAHVPEIRGAVAEGGYHRLSEEFRVENGNVLARLMQSGIEITYRLTTGDDVSVLAPIDVMQRIPPRMVFLVYGSQEITLRGAQAKLAAYRAAAPPKQQGRAALWVVPGADHGGYLGAAGREEYARQTVAFYDCALFDKCSAWDATWEQNQ